MPTPDKGEHWGILGGAFDPVHLGHTTLAADIYRIKRLAGILLVPSVNHPFKSDRAVADFQQRVEMLTLAVADFDFFVIDEIEKDKQLSGYTIDTILELKKKFPGVTLSFLIGSDNIGQLTGWHQPERILEEVSVVAGTRPGHQPDSTANPLLSQVEYVETRAVDVSSSQIRDIIRAGAGLEKLNDWLHPEVIAYIKSRSLYE